VTLSIPGASEISTLEENRYLRYSICTIVTNEEEYQEMLSSFEKAGFDNTNSEFIYADNSQGNRHDGYETVNRFLRSARGRYVVLCHQDIRLHDDGILDLDQALDALTIHDPSWAAAGNAGGVRPGHLAIRITDPHGVDTRLGPFPVPVASLDENFIVVKKSAGLSVSNDLTGFHFYGTDLCIVAQILGYRCYVIDFHLWHIGGGSQPGKKSDAGFRSDYPLARARLLKKYRRAFSPRWLQNTGGTLFLSGFPLLNYLGNRKLVLSLARRLLRNRVG
jgi:hypothetical protein